MHSSHHRLPGPVDVAVLDPSPEARVGDADRERTVALLGDAAAAGYLRLDELDQRLSAAWSATTVAQLSAVENDLPEQLPGSGPAARPLPGPGTSPARASARTYAPTPP